jgi:hypothetical protein
MSSTQAPYHRHADPFRNTAHGGARADEVATRLCKSLGLQKTLELLDVSKNLFTEACLTAMLSRLGARQLPLG